MSEKAELSHAGVKGMKWGVRKQAIKKRSPKKKKKPSTATTRYTKAPNKLSSNELQKRIKRMEQEKRYNDLNTRDMYKGRTTVKKTLGKTGTQTLSFFAGGAAIYGGKLVLNKMFKGDVTSKIYGK